MPKNMGGWGILNIRYFNSAILEKLLWHAIKGEGIWNNIVYTEYLYNDPLYLLYIRQLRLPRFASAIWKGFQKILNFFVDMLIWSFGNALDIIIGRDRICGMDKNAIPDQRMTLKLARRGIFFLSQTIHYWSIGVSVMKDADMLGLSGEDAQAWTTYVHRIKATCLYYDARGDRITWNDGQKCGMLIIKETYISLLMLGT